MKLAVMCFGLVLVLFVNVSFPLVPLDAGYSFLGNIQSGFSNFIAKCSTQASCPKEKKTAEEKKDKNEEQNKEDEGVPSTNSQYKINLYQREFIQKLDHFNSSDVRDFPQRYIVNNDHYKEGSPVILLLGGVEEIESCHCNTGIWNYFAKELNALIVYLEHRFYGKSSATKVYSTENLEYLSTEQSLADVAYFIDEITKNNPAKIKIPRQATWIAMGSAYGGTLAALFKMKFPHLLRGAIVENAPLLPILDISEFYNDVEQQCIKEKIDGTIREAFQKLKNKFDSCEENDRNCVQQHFDSLRDTFKFCMGELNINYDVKTHIAFLYWSLTTTIGLALIYGNENDKIVRDDVIQILHDNETPDSLDRLGLAVQKVLDSHDINCLLIDYSKLVTKYQDTSLDAEFKLNYILYEGFGNRQYLYQRCAEWGHFETAYKDNGIFAHLFSIDFYQKLCGHVFDEMYGETEFMNRAITRTLMFYGGQEIKVKDVLFIVSENDFWHRLGYLGRKPKNEITDGESFTFVIKDKPQEEYKDDWSFAMKTLKQWSEVKTIEKEVPTKNN